jgi:hypothetical protein
MRDLKSLPLWSISGRDLASHGLTRVEARGVFPMRDPFDEILCKSVRRSSGR